LDIGSGLSRAYGVAISGDDVYAAGYKLNAQGKSVATLWKNGAAQELSDGRYASSVFVFENDVYVAGYEDQRTWVQAIVWKNGAVHQRLTGGEKNSFTTASSIFVTEP
jgi:hypothetical protein